MKLLYGTTNQAKYNLMKDILEELAIDLISLKDLDIVLPTIDESGNDPLENAKIKATAYYQAIGMPVFSCDSGLYIEGMDDSRQPGVHIRRVGGKVLNDEEMISYYGDLALQAGGEVTARYRNAIALVLVEGTCRTYDGEDIESTKFLITSEAHKKRVSGFPLDSLSKDLRSGKYYLDIRSERAGSDSSMAAGFQRFFQAAFRDLPMLIV